MPADGEPIHLDLSLDGDEIVSAEGYVLAVRILEDKSTYNTVEDVTGRMLALRAGDVLAGVIGGQRQYEAAWKDCLVRAESVRAEEEQ